MKKKDEKLSWVGRYAHASLKKNSCNTPRGNKILSLLCLVLISWFIYSAFSRKEMGYLIPAGLWFGITMRNLMLSGFQELLEKGYFNKENSNQRVESIVITPVDEVEPQSTQAHP